MKEMEIMAISHANCTHPRTPAGRRACRAGNAAALAVIAPTGVPTSPGLRHPEVKMTGAVARRMARQAAAADRVRAVSETATKPRQMPAAAPRIQGRRIPARVVRDASGCVQAALHTSGRCACGWHAANHCAPEIWACAGH